MVLYAVVCHPLRANKLYGVLNISDAYGNAVSWQNFNPSVVGPQGGVPRLPGTLKAPGDPYFYSNWVMDFQNST